MGNKGKKIAPVRPPIHDAIPTRPARRPVDSGGAISERKAVISEATIEQPMENSNLNARRLEKKEKKVTGNIVLAATEHKSIESMMSENPVA
ncbi:hypothetical protein DI09_35p60 [Mitosporidium daphniae]|uniref:Uncharacterized protein n=1 Tax=Mitosporidium daphniae TaxID=1485682 RepID=A0A098VQW5_9MICR|nr:uncharacterized protein DI09_35p60 [Mitosporidium daphniae]KGG51418.1 hypothetical protein DI09_35p60 [Mitosporidium daphniae]|eukprot:XP_013237876.1 uncharacterized protein DI09_35p60 [Mitosporidium daphniae]